MSRDVKLTLPNEVSERAIWLRLAAEGLRDHFSKARLPLPEKIRFGFSTKGRKTSLTGECWHSPASRDHSYEIFIRADMADPLEVLGILARQLVHAAIDPGPGHGKRFKAAAEKIGLVGRMHVAQPGLLLQERLKALAEQLGPLPHAALDLNWTAFDRPKKQGTRMLKAECVKDCGYTVRLSAKWAREYGVVCPRHGRIVVDLTEDQADPNFSVLSSGPSA